MADPPDAEAVNSQGVSIIIPAYNAAATVGETLDSVLSQTFQRWEVIVIDDGSTDGTLKIAGSYRDRDRRIRLQSQARAGVCAARNRGIMLASYEWLLFLDADDLILSTHLERMIGEATANPRTDVAHCGWVRVTPDGVRWKEEYGPRSRDLFPVLARYCPFAIHTAIVRRDVVEAVGNFDPSYRTCEDWDLWQRIARSGACFTPVAEGLAIYRMRPGSLSRDSAQFFCDGLRVQEQGHAPDPRVPNPHPEYAAGMKATDLSPLRLSWAAWTAGLILGSGSDARPLLSTLQDEHSPILDPILIAQSLFESLPLPSCQAPATLYRVWPGIERVTLDFLEALEALSFTPGLARRTVVVLERMILEHAEAELPVAAGASEMIQIEITQPLPDIHPLFSTAYLYCLVQVEGTTVGTVELPVYDEPVPSWVLADAIVAGFAWTILGYFFTRTVYAEPGSGILATLREQEVAPDNSQEYHDRSGWMVFLRELWNCPDWPAERFYNTEFTRKECETRQLDGHRLQFEVSQDLLNVKFDGPEIEVEVLVGGAVIGVVTVPVRNGIAQAQEILAAVTTACGFELCRAAVREALLGRPMVLPDGMNSLRARLYVSAMAASPLKKTDEPHPDSYSKCGLMDDEKAQILGRRTPQLFGTSASRYARLPMGAASDLLEMAMVAGEPVIKAPSADNRPDCVIYRPDLVPFGFPYRQVQPSATRSSGVVPAGGMNSSRNSFEALFVSREDPWSYTSAYEQAKYEQTLALLPATPMKKVLEIGCAEGHFTVQLAPRVRSLLAIDISRIALERAAERCKKLGNISYKRLDLTKEPLPGHFNLIVCSEVLYYVGSMEVLREVAVKLVDALEPGGYLLMAHANLIVDEPDRPGFDWGSRFGAKVIGETFVAIGQLKLVKEISVPLYRIQLFQRAPRGLRSFQFKRRKPEIMSFPEQPTALSPEIAEHVRWNGGTLAVADTADQEVSTARLPILMYHRVSPAGAPSASCYRVDPTTFEEQLRYLHEVGFYSAGLDEWRVARKLKRPLPGRAVMLTFDDGYHDFLEYAWPLLKRYGFMATVFLVADRIGQFNHWDRVFGEDVPLLTWEEVFHLQGEGIQFGSHSSSHSPLTALSAYEVVREIARARAILERNLKVTINAFAYPYGDTNRAVQHLTGACGYVYGLTCRYGLSRYQDSLLALPRIEVTGSDSLKEFIAKVNGQ